MYNLFKNFIYTIFKFVILHTALALIQKIQNEVTAKKFSCTIIIELLKELRTISLEEKNPVLTKALRLAYEHLENKNAFYIGIPSDEFSKRFENKYGENIYKYQFKPIFFK